MLFTVFDPSSEKLYFGKLIFASDEQEFSFRGVKCKMISSHPG